MWHIRIKTWRWEELAQALKYEGIVGYQVVSTLNNEVTVKTTWNDLKRINRLAKAMNHTMAYCHRAA